MAVVTMLIQGIFCQALSPKPHFPAPLFGQVLPAWIELFNQHNLLFPPPALDLLFTRNGHLHVLVALVVNQPMALIFLGEPSIVSYLCW
ncbi:MAG TPA: hypothetical protein VFY05_11185 [Candidatus Angelobacter sp.]|nr:hypothetical protein [Candidatus Angelobacter sp.]